MSNKTQQAVLQEIVARVMTDADFRSRLLSDVGETLRDEGYALDEATLARLESQAGEARNMGMGERFDAEMLKRPEFSL